MIARIWHGYTTPENAAAYEEVHRAEVSSELEAKHINGYKGLQLLKNEKPGEVEFTTILWFETLEDVIEFAGEDYEAAWVPEAARKVLNHYDSSVKHSKMIYSSL
jgi:heme-degrading monooxygenase HmoA